MLSDKIIEDILTIRLSGICNMIDINSVQIEANKQGFFELVIFLEEHKIDYVNFILTGQR